MNGHAHILPCSLPHHGPRDVEIGFLVIPSRPTTTEPLCLPPVHPRPSGIAAPTGKPCPSGSVCLPPLGPWPFYGPYHRPPSKHPDRFKPVRLADGTFPAVGGHAWNVPNQQFKICGTGSLPAPTGVRGPKGTGMPKGTGTGGVAMPTGTTGAMMPAPLGDVQR